MDSDRRRSPSSSGNLDSVEMQTPSRVWVRSQGPYRRRSNPGV